MGCLDNGALSWRKVDGLKMTICFPLLSHKKEKKEKTQTPSKIPQDKCYKTDTIAIKFVKQPAVV